MDWLDPQVPIDWLADFLKVIYECQNLDWLLLTKRPENCKKLIYYAKVSYESRFGANTFVRWMFHWFNGTPPQNVWFGVTVENQGMADKRIPELLRIPSKVRWLSVEPLLEDIDIQSAFGKNLGCGDAPADPECTECGYLTRKVDWVVVGGESGNKRRDCGTAAIANVAAQCLDAVVPVFVKQDCHRLPGHQGRLVDEIWNLKQFPTT